MMTHRNPNSTKTLENNQSKKFYLKIHLVVSEFEFLGGSSSLGLQNGDESFLSSWWLRLDDSNNGSL